MDALPDKLMYWRHYAAGLKYLRKKGETSLSSEKREELDTKLEEYERLESKSHSKEKRHLRRESKILRALELRREDLDKPHPGLEHNGQQQTHDWQNRVPYPLPAPQESLLKFNFPPWPPGKPQTVSLPLRDSLDRLLSGSSSFTVKSGILLLGQLHTVFAGSIDPIFQGNAEDQPAMPAGGTIKQHPLRYRSAARNGQWKVRKIFSTKYWEGAREAARHFGWVVYHEEVDALEAVERCDRMISPSGLSHGNDHVDKDVLNVNRYDWAHHAPISTTNPNFESQYRAFLHSVTSAQLTDTANLTLQEIVKVESLQSRKGFHKIALDAAHFFPQFVATLVRDCPTDDDPPLRGAERIFAERDEEGDYGFGVFVSKARVEYEFGFDFAIEEDPGDDFTLVPETVGSLEE
ncbi:MAG: hypothetical protein Q9209_006231 [Squamulea sp. 1 TL-2023]